MRKGYQTVIVAGSRQHTKVDHWLKRLLRHPLLISVVSYGGLALIILNYSSLFQHENWKQQFQMQQEAAYQENLFKKRADLAKEVTFLIKVLRRAAFDSVRAGKDYYFSFLKNLPLQRQFEYQDILNRYLGECKDAESRLNALILEMNIYFQSQQGRAATGIAVQIVDEWSGAVTRFDSMLEGKDPIEIMEKGFPAMLSDLNKVDNKTHELLKGFVTIVAVILKEQRPSKE